ncbi:MAG TPA: flippase [Halococcus sp.]|nr:flippase [Halococcus sp.]
MAPASPSVSNESSGIGKLARSSAIIFVGTVFGQVLGLFGELLIIRSLDPDRYGVLALGYTVVLVASRLAVIGIPPGVTRIASTNDDRATQASIFRAGYSIVLIIGAFALTALFLFRELIAKVMGGPELASILIPLLPIVVVFPLGMVSFSGLRIFDRSIAAVLSRDIGSRIGAITLLAAGILLGQPMLGAIAYWVTIPLLLFVLVAYFLRRDIPLRDVIGVPHRDELERVWSFSWPLAVASSFILLMSNVDTLMIGYFLGSKQVGYYRALQPLRKVTLFVLSSFLFVYLPQATRFYSEGEIEKLTDLYRVSTKWIGAGTFPFVLVFVVFAPDVIRVFLGVEYLPGTLAFQVLIAGLLLTAFVGPNGATIKALDRPRLEMYSALLGLVVNVALNVVLIPALGIVGAAIATIMGYAVYELIEVTVIYRLTGDHPFSIANVKPLVPTAIVAVSIAKVLSPYKLGLAALIGIGVVISTVQLVSMIFTRSLEPSDRMIVRQIETRAGIDLSFVNYYIDDPE